MTSASSYQEAAACWSRTAEVSLVQQLTLGTETQASLQLCFPSSELGKAVGMLMMEVLRGLLLVKVFVIF